MTQPRSRKILAVCFDFGDTLADEATEIKDETQTTLRAELIPGADELIRELHGRGYPLALVADGRPGTYHNVLRQHGLHDLFSAWAISELLGEEKPSARMFAEAFTQLGLPLAEARRVVMVGNRLDRDVRGANEMGMISVWMNWSPRYGKTPSHAIEIPKFTIRQPAELLNVIDELESGSSSSP